MDTVLFYFVFILSHMYVKKLCDCFKKKKNRYRVLYFPISSPKVIFAMNCEIYITKTTFSIWNDLHQVGRFLSNLVCDPIVKTHFASSWGFAPNPQKVLTNWGVFTESLNQNLIIFTLDINLSTRLYDI